MDNNGAVVVVEVDSTLDIDMADYMDHKDSLEVFDLQEESWACNI